LIQDTAISGDTTHTYSVDKVLSLIASAKSEILGGLAPTALDTITELAAFLVDGTVASGVVSQLANRVRVDAVQTFTAAEQIQARQNTGAASNVELQTLITNVGDLTTNFADLYSASKV
jgi:hypothetical protein